MTLINKLFGSKEASIQSYEDFWNWFRENEKAFFKVLNSDHADVEAEFFDRISPKLNELKQGFYLLAGMMNDQTAELIFSAEGEVRNIVFVEEIVSAAPQIDGWKFTALKQPETFDNLEIKMNEYVFNANNIHFCANELEDYPDEIDISIVYDQLTDSNREMVINGAYIFIDNFLGELDSLVSIDNMNIIGRNEATSELIPISKLKSYLVWRQKEFVEKYDGFRHDAENDQYASFEAELPNGKNLIAIMNTTLLDWDSKASHPWLVILTIKYEGENESGMPNSKDYERMNEIEDEIMLQLLDSDGYLNLGRQTADDEREIYFACTDFRLPSKVLYAIQQKYGEAFEIDYEIYKDKYWKWFERFNQR